MTAILADGIRLDGTSVEISDTLRALGLGRLAGATAAVAASPPSPPGLSVLDSPAPTTGGDADLLRAFLSGEATAWDETGEIEAA